jgi:WD40 repeat protein
MILDDKSGHRNDENEQALVVACDALLRAASTEPRSEFRSVPSPKDRGHDRLRLLLEMLDAAELGADTESVEERVSDGKGSDTGRPVLGRFEVIDHLGSGGFGFVVRAHDRLLGREVALKMPLPERVLSRGDFSRFLREARAAARLDHPNIIRVFDAGELGPLGYFIASEFCEGPTLKSWLKSQTEAVPARLAARWAAALAGAVEQAHDRGILHRDIKPSNVILSGGPAPGAMIPRLTDFGLAKLLGDGGDETRSDARMGTPDYMAPEQASGHREALGPAADIYSLGATLYEALAGRPPFRGENDAETLRLAKEAEPAPLRSLHPGVPRDLETICLKCLRKVPRARYSSARELREDLERFLDNRPIHGRPVSRAERAWVWARRRPAVASLLVLVGLLTSGLLGGVAAWVRSLERHNRQLQFQIARADAKAAEAARSYQIAQDRQHHADRHRYAASLRRAREALDARQFELAQDILHEIGPELAGNVKAGFPWGFLWRRATRDFTQLWGHEATLQGLVISADGTTLVTYDLAGKILVWSLSTVLAPDRPSAVLATTRTHDDELRLVLSRDGRLLAVVSNASKTGIVDLFETRSGPRVARLRGEVFERARDCAFDPVGERLVLLAGRPDGSHVIRSWTIANGGSDPHVWVIKNDSHVLSLSAAGQFVAAFHEKTVHLYDVWTGALKRTLADSDLSKYGLASLFTVSDDAQVVAGHTNRGQLPFWEASSGSDLARFDANTILSMRLGPSGSRLAVMNHHGGVTVFQKGLERRVNFGPRMGDHTLNGYAMSFSSDERLLAIVVDRRPGGLQRPEVWDLASSRRVNVYPGRKDIASLEFIPKLRALAATGGAKPRIWRLDPPGLPDACSGHAAEAWATAFSPDGRVLATGSDDTNERQTIKLWDPASGRLLAGWKGHTATVASLDFSPDGRLLASSSLDSGKPGNPNLLVWDVASRKPLANLTGHLGSVRSLAFSPDGKLLASAGDDGSLRLWSTADYSSRAVLTGHTTRLTSVAFSPDSGRIASASCDATVKIWDVPAGKLLTTLPSSGNVNAVAFNPDGSLVASASETGEVTLWNPSTGAAVLTIHSAADLLRCLAFTRDGCYLTASGKDKIIRLWDIATGQEVLSLTGHEAQVNALAFSPDGLVLASCSHDGAVKLWRAEPIEVVPRRSQIHPVQ